MPYTKSDISKDIAFKASLSNKKSQQLLEKFIELVRLSSNTRKVKINSFGTFERYVTPARSGRNPKTGEEFDIPERSKLKLTVSNKIREKIN
jgi:integration host factor subunit alpha